MTEILIVSFLLLGAGYIVGKLFIGLNPFLMIIGFILIGITAPAFIEMNNDFYMACFVIGGLLNFNRPVTYIRSLLSDFFGTLSLRRAGAGYIEKIEIQKQQAEEELARQKREIEEEIRRQKREAEQDLKRQQREAEEAIKREAENLRREREMYQQSSNNSQDNSQQSNNSASGNKHLNPLVFADACEIMGLSQGKTLKEYKTAYHKLIKLYHSDGLSGLSDELKKQEEEKAKALNVAMNTIKKKLK
jgi:hypothetical protein